MRQLKTSIDSLSQERRSGPADLRGDRPTTEQLQSIVAHFQKLFDVSSVSGVFPRMNEIYVRLGETFNTMNTMKELLNLGMNWEGGGVGGRGGEGVSSAGIVTVNGSDVVTVLTRVLLKFSRVSLVKVLGKSSRLV